MNDRILDKIAREGPLQTLGAVELEFDRRAVTTDPQPERVRAWVRFGAVPVRVDADACMWTATAVALRFRANDREFKCWVWRGAVEAAPSPPGTLQR